MATSVDWGTKVIFVPRADLTLLQISPEIRELNVNTFRLDLKDLEDSEAGMPFLDTHRHNTEVTLAGLVYARIVEVINGYTVEFEDGQYTVACVGANHNLSDVKVANQVSLIVNNAAGLISMEAIEFSSFDNAVHIDVTSSNTGTVFPTGTAQQPVNNLTDAKLIATTRGFNKLQILGNITFLATDNIDGFFVWGETYDATLVTVLDGCSTINSHFNACALTGTVAGAVGLEDVHIAPSGLFGFTPGHIHRTVFEGDLGITGSGNLHIINCWSGVPGHEHPDIDMGGGSGPGLGVRNWNGGLGIKNLSNTRNISLDMNSGHVHLHDDITNGTFVIRGIAKMTDDSSGSADVDISNLINTILYDSLGIIGENVKWSAMAHDSNNNLTLATITQYTDSTLVVIRKQWQLTATYNADSELTAYQLKEL